MPRCRVGRTTGGPPTRYLAVHWTSPSTTAPFPAVHPILSEALVILALLLLNGVFAASEIAVVTSRRARLEQRAAGGSTGARRALALLDEPTRFLSTVQIGITLIGVLAGAYGGATIAAQLDDRLEQIPALVPFSEAIAFAVVVGAVSFASLVIGELVPKRIAMQAPERLAAVVAAPMQLLARLAAPLVSVLTATTTTILRSLRVHEADGSRVTEEEIRSMIAEGRRSGVVHVAEHEMLEGVFRLGDRYVRDLMIPRPDVDWVDVEEGVQGVGARLQRPASDAFLLCRGSLDDVVGVLRPQRLLARALAGEAPDFVAESEAPLFVPGSMSILGLLERLKQARQRLAVVLDEYGGVEGVITLDEVLEEVVGEVPDVADDEHPEMVARADGTWLVDGAVDFEELSERFALGEIPANERGHYRTVAGFVMERLGRIPRASDAVVWNGTRFEVIDMDQRRVDKVLVTPARK